MKSTSLGLVGLSTLLTTAAAIVGLSTACTQQTNADDKDGGSSSGQSSSGASSSGASGDGGASSSSGNSSSGNTTSGGTPISSCTTATLWAGDPTFDAPDPSTRPTDGTGILADPPFQWGSLTFSGNMLYTRDTGEIWYVDTSAANPVEKHLLGKNQGNEVALKFGACSTALVGAIEGIAVLKDGSLVAPDAFANSIVHIKDPQGAGCVVESWAGTKDDTTFEGMNYPNLGDVDGALGTSKIGYPTAIATDASDTVYFYDGQARKFKKIANDANHTVSTIGKMPDDLDICYGMITLNNTIYALGYGGSTTNIYKIDGTNITKVAGGGPDYWDLQTTPQLGGITTDGTNIIVAGMGYMWLVKLSDGSAKVIAGSGERVDLVKAGYDPKAPHPALEVTLKPEGSASFASVGSPDYLAFRDGAVYYRGHGPSTAAYVEKIQCQ